MKIADDLQNVFGSVSPPSQLQSYAGKSPNDAIGLFISRIIEIVYSAAIIVVVFMLVIGAFQWITSGGEKEAVAKARNRIMYALIGLALLALSFLILQVLGGVLGFKLFQSGARCCTP